MLHEATLAVWAACCVQLLKKFYYPLILWVVVGSDLPPVCCV